MKEDIEGGSEYVQHADAGQRDDSRARRGRGGQRETSSCDSQRARNGKRVTRLFLESPVYQSGWKSAAGDGHHETCDRG